MTDQYQNKTELLTLKNHQETISSSIMVWGIRLEFNAEKKLIKNRKFV